MIKKRFKVIKKDLVGWLRLELLRHWSSQNNISKLRELYGIQLSSEQLSVITTAVKEKKNCKLLIFGLGNDSVFWAKLNRDGVTVFIEDNQDWYQKITKKINGLTVKLVNYNTLRPDWEKLLGTPSLLKMPLAKDLEKTEWDVILIDAPAGWNDQTPGRMKSIYLSSSLAKSTVDIFAHDCNREVEDIYCTTFLKKENLIVEVDGSCGLLRHYRIKNTAT